VTRRRARASSSHRKQVLHRPQWRGHDLGPTHVQELLDGVPVLGPGVGPEGGRHLSGLQQQARGTDVPLAGGGPAQFLGQFQLEVVQQHLVVAETAAVVLGGGEDSPLLEFLQDSLTAAGIEQPVAQLARQDAQRTRAAHEIPQRRREFTQDLAHQVRADQP
jgi:hypothetical protein